MLGILKSIKDLLKRSLERVISIFKQSWQAFSSIFKTSTSNKQQSKEDKKRSGARLAELLQALTQSVENVLKNPASLQEIAISLGDKVVAEKERVQVKFFSRLNELAKRRPELEQLRKKVLDRVLTRGPVEHAVLNSKFLEHRKVPDHFTSRQAYGLYNLLYAVDFHTKIIAEDSKRLCGHVQLLATKIEKEKDDEVRSEFSSRFAASAKIHPEVRQLKDEVDRVIKSQEEIRRAEASAVKLHSEFLARYIDTLPSEEEQNQDLHELLLLFSDCVEYINVNKSILNSKVDILMLKLDGLMFRYKWNRNDRGVVIQEFLSRVEEFIKSRPEAYQIIEELEKIIKQRHLIEAQCRAKTKELCGFWEQDITAANAVLFNLLGNCITLRYDPMPLAFSLLHLKDLILRSEREILLEFAVQLYKFAKLYPKEATQIIDEAWKALNEFGITITNLNLKTQVFAVQRPESRLKSDTQTPLKDQSYKTEDMDFFLKFFMRNERTPLGFDCKQQEDLEDLIHRFNKCLALAEGSILDKTYLIHFEPRSVLLYAKIEGLINEGGEEVVAEFSSRVSNLVKLHPEIITVIEKISKVIENLGIKQNISKFTTQAPSYAEELSTPAIEMPLQAHTPMVL